MNIQRLSADVAWLMQQVKQLIGRKEGNPYPLPGIKTVMTLEDWAGDGCWCKWVEREDNTEKSQLYVYQNVITLTGAKAGYKFIAGWSAEKEWHFLQGDCITKCQTDGTFNATPSVGQVGVGYSYDPSATDINAGTFGASGLPPGLSIDSDSGVVSGNPTTAGDYRATVTAQSAGTGPNSGETCTITRIMEFTIDEAE